MQLIDALHNDVPHVKISNNFATSVFLNLFVLPEHLRMLMTSIIVTKS